MTQRNPESKMFEAKMHKHVERLPVVPSTYASAKKKKKKNTKAQPCRRCQKMGHWASECTAPAPVAAKSVKEAEN